MILLFFVFTTSP